MSKASAKAYGILQDLIDNQKIIQIEKKGNKYELTVFNSLSFKEHHHFDGENLIEAIMKVK